MVGHALSGQREVAPETQRQQPPDRGADPGISAAVAIAKQEASERNIAMAVSESAHNPESTPHHPVDECGALVVLSVEDFAICC